MVAESKSSSRVFLVSSLALGVLAMGAAFVYLENTAGQEKGPKATILVAKHDLREGAQIDPEKDLDVMEIPARLESLKGLALRPEDRTTYKGQRVTRNIFAGTPVLLPDLAATATLELRGDSRAISIGVKGANGMSGLIVPGDYVKLMVTRPVPAGPRAAPSTNPADAGVPLEAPTAARWDTVLVGPTPYRVLAVNQRLSRSRPQVTAAEAYQGAGESNAQQTVTLEVTEAQAKTVLEQTGAGQLPVTLVLCPPPVAGAP